MSDIETRLAAFIEDVYQHGFDTPDEWMPRLPAHGLRLSLADTPDDGLRAAALLALPELDRLTDIIEGQHEQARLVPPHGQSSARPRQAADALRAALAAAPREPVTVRDIASAMGVDVSDIPSSRPREDEGRFCLNCRRPLTCPDCER